MYLCDHIYMLINCLPLKLAYVTACVDFLSCESSDYLLMKIYAIFVRSLTMLDILDTQFRGRMSKGLWTVCVLNFLWYVPVSRSCRHVWGLRMVSDPAGVGNVSQMLRQVVHVAVVVRLLLYILPLFWVSCVVLLMHNLFVFIYFVVVMDLCYRIQDQVYSVYILRS